MLAILLAGCGEKTLQETPAKWSIDQQVAISGAQAAQAEIVLDRSKGDAMPVAMDKVIAIAKEHPCEIWDDAELGKLTMSELLAKDAQQIRPYRPKVADQLERVQAKLPDCK